MYSAARVANSLLRALGSPGTYIAATTGVPHTEKVICDIYNAALIQLSVYLLVAQATMLVAR